MVGVMDRCPTGIKGFDKISAGGFIRNSDNLIVGGPGSGKSTFLLQFLWNGATMFNENGLYCSFEPDIVDTVNDAMAYGWDFTKISAEGRIKFMRFSPQTSIEDLKSEIIKIVSKFNIRRICFDPISVLALNINENGKMREKIFEISSLMKRFKVTTIFADESMEGEGLERTIQGEWTKTDILKFLSDSVTQFYETGVTGQGDRAARIVKMRRTAHLRETVGMQITETGIEIFHDGLELTEVEMGKQKSIAPEEILKPIEEESKEFLDNQIKEIKIPKKQTIEEIQYQSPPEEISQKKEIYTNPISNEKTIVSSEPINETKNSPEPLEKKIIKPLRPQVIRHPSIQGTQEKQSMEINEEIKKIADKGLEKIRQEPKNKVEEEDELWH